MCSKNIIGNPVEELRSELKEELLREIKIKELEEKLHHVAPSEDVKFLMLQMTPCILYLETRVSVTIITLILQDSLGNAKGRHLENTHNVNSDHKREEMWKSFINLLLNNHILGNNINEHQCDLPLADNPSGAGRRIGNVILKTQRLEK